MNKSGIRFRSATLPFAVCSLTFALALTSCSSRPANPRGRIVSLVPSVTEIIYALGQGRQLAGNTTFCNFPPAAESVYKVGDFSNPSVEKIARLKPSLVFATLPEQQATVEQLRRMGSKVFISRPSDIDSMFREIKSIAQVLGAAATGDSLVAALKARLARIPPPSVRPRVYVEISGQPLMTVGQGTFINEAIERAGGHNIFSDINKEYPVVTQEQVIQRDPEVVFILHPQTNRTEFAQRLGWQNVSAVRQNRIYDDLNPDLLFRSGPRLVEGIEKLAAEIGS